MRAERGSKKKGKKGTAAAMPWEAVLSCKPRKHISRRSSLACDEKLGVLGRVLGTRRESERPGGRSHRRGSRVKAAVSFGYGSR